MRSFLTGLLCLLPALAQADDKPTASKPIRALLVTGGCCHDYQRQKLIIARGVSARANVVWTVVHQGGSTTNTKIPLYEDADWAEGFDVVVHNECFAHVKDKEWVERILKPHREGTPAVLIHCAMHCYRTGDDQWFEFVGVQSPNHGPKYAYTVKNLQPKHPIMSEFGPQWITPMGELYHTIKLFPTATPLAEAPKQADGSPQTCIWTNEYGKNKTRVFGTTIGHHNETMVEPEYLDMVTRGILWATGRDVDKEFTPTTQQTNDEIKKLISAKIEAPASEPDLSGCCGAANLAFGQPTKASSEETGKNNFAKNAVDGKLSTRWCASNGSGGQTWQVDLGKVQPVSSVRIHWEGNTAYQYKVDASQDGEKWQTIVDQSKNKKRSKINPHKFDSVDVKFLRVTYLSSKSGGWGSFWEFEAYSGDLPELPKSLQAGDAAGTPNELLSDVKLPEGFEATIFGAPPEVNYPVCISAAPTGELFVGVDEQGSLGKEPGKGKILRCLDTDGDGTADKVNEFVKVDHPRGLIYDAGSLWVLHPPFLSVYHDDNLDGVSDRHETLITGISTEQVDKRGADHTTNGIRMGIDGWIYIAVGDFGFVDATGTDGRKLTRRGGGVVRVRPNGTDMEVFSWGQRNILDVCIDPYLNMFTRDNTNDGGGWDIRTTHVMQSADYGYPSRYLHFAEETMPPLADYGGGSGCGAMYFHDLRWPEPFANAAYTCDWGRSEVYRHNFPQHGATFDPHQEVFLKIPRPTDIDVDGSGRMYVSSWKNGKFNYSGPNVGFVAQIQPKNFLPKPFPDLDAASNAELVEMLSSPSAVYQLHSQREILRGGPNAEVSDMLAKVAKSDDAPLHGRVAAIFTLKQLDGIDSHMTLLALTTDSAVSRFALRALTDRTSELKSLPSEPFVAALESDDLRTRAQAVICLGRLGDASVAEKVLPLTQRSADEPKPDDKKFHAQPDPGRVIPHLAVQALIDLEAVDACLTALDGPFRAGALQTLRQIYSPAVVTGLIKGLNKTSNVTERREVLATLIRLYYQEGEYKGDWWGTRPDNSGPIYDRQPWAESERIASVVKTALGDANEETTKFIEDQIVLHKVKADGLGDGNLVAMDEPEPQTAIEVPKVDSNDPNLIANLSFEAVAERALKAKGDAGKGAELFRSQACIACHTYADGQKPKGPHLVDIGKRYKPAELVESILKPSEKIAQGFDTFSFLTTSGQVETGFVVSESAETVTIRSANGLSKEIIKPDIEDRIKRELSMMPEGLVSNLTPEQLADLIAYLRSLK